MIELKQLRKSYTTGGFTQKALDGVSLNLRSNEFVAVLGPSGSGKTTLLNILGGLDRADSGDIVINGRSTSKYKSADWDTYRNHEIGFIFQSYNLIPHQSVVGNVELALTLAGVGRAERRKRALHALERVGLGEHANKKPNQLSGGQMQRVAIARALVNDPAIVLADEPTGALDTETGLSVMELLSEIAQDRLVVMVTHNPELAEQYATRIVRLADGRIVSDSNPPGGTEAAALMAGAAGKADETAQATAKARGRARTAASGEAEREGAAAGKRVAAAATAAAAAGAAPRHAAAAEPAAEGAVRAARSAPRRHASMSFLTALALSFKNLMMKKGRTFMTAFAGSIGIIGIAAILSLSNGVNNYIADTEEEALTSYPITITKSSFDFASLLGSSMGVENDGAEEEEGESNAARGWRVGIQGEEESTAKRAGGPIEEISVMTDMFAQVKNNNLGALKTYFDGKESGIDQYVHTIQYSYGITPYVYKLDTSQGVTRLNPSSMGTTFSGGVDASAFGISGTGSDMFSEMMDNRELLESYMDVVAGRWPERYDECLLVLSSTGRLTDYTLYSIGYYDPDIMDKMTQDALNGKEVVAPATAKDFSVEKALEMEFSVVPSTSMYEYNASQHLWTDVSNDNEIMKRIIADGIKLKVVGVVQPSPDVNAIAMKQGIAYTPELTEQLMKVAAESDIVKQQIERPNNDVFTGKTFEELQNEEGVNFDMQSMFDVDEDALRNAFAFDTSALSGMSFDASALNMDASSMNFDASALSGAIDPSTMSNVFNEQTMRQLMAGAPAFSVESIGQDQNNQLTEEQQQLLSTTANTLAAGFWSWGINNNKFNVAGGVPASAQDAASQAQQQAAQAQQQAAQAAQDAQQATQDLRDAAAQAAQDPQAAAEAAQDAAQAAQTAAEQARQAAQEAQDQSASQAQDAAAQAQDAAAQARDAAAQAAAANQPDYSALFQEYLQTEDARKILDPVRGQLGDVVEQQVTQAMQNYLVNQFAPYLSQGMQRLMTQAAQGFAIQLGEALQAQMAAVTGSIGSTIGSAISGQLQSQMSQLQDLMSGGFSFDANAFANAIKFNMTQDDLTSLLSNYMNADELTYDGNMKKLGYAKESEPDSVSIYPIDFESKEQVLRIIDRYNDRMKTEGKDESVIQYSDFAGILMSSVTDIIDTISLVLIAFVSISLVVSSIMIGIITYISVLERKKEIGILRAMGASKRNIANVFNAETVIEGLIAGVLAIAVVKLVSIPVNAFVEAGWNVPNVMSLPWSSAGVLVAISVVLTFIAGLIPSQSASRRDPVEALRSE